MLNERAHLGPKYRFRLGFIEQSSKLGDGLHHLDSIFLSGKTLVHLQKRHHTFYVPKVISRRLSLDVPVHCVLEQDGANNPLPVKSGAGNETRAHLMYQRKHLLFVGPGTFFDTVKTQCLGRATPALIQRRNEAGMRFNFLQLLFVDAERFHNASFEFSMLVD